MADAVIAQFWQRRRLAAGPAERRNLEPICTAVQARNPKLALQNCSKALRIKPYNPLVQTLQAIILYGVDEEESLRAIQDVVKDEKGKGKALEDADLLMLCAWVFEQTGQVHESADMWAAASERESSQQLNILLEACFYYVRITAFEHLWHACTLIAESRTRLQMRGEEEAFFQQAFWYRLQALVIMVTDLSAPHIISRIRRDASGRSVSVLSGDLQETEEASEANRQHAKQVKELLVKTHKELFGDSAALVQSLERVTTYHEFYLLVRLAELRVQAEAEAADNADVSVLLQILNSAEGRAFSAQNIDIESLRRRLILKHGELAGDMSTETVSSGPGAVREAPVAKMEQETAQRQPPILPALPDNIGPVAAFGTINQLWHDAHDKICFEGGSNWNTILTLVEAAWSIAGKSGTATAAANASEDGEDIPGWWTVDEEDGSSVECLRATRKLLKKCAAPAAASEAKGTSSGDRGFALGLLALASFPAHEGNGELTAFARKVVPGLVNDYVRQHGSKQCCFDDLLPYLTLLMEQHRDGVRLILKHLDERFSRQDIDVSTLSYMQASMTVERLRRFLQGHYAGVEEEAAQGHRYAKAYFAALHFGKNNIVTDLQPADDFALLAAQAYLGAWTQATIASSTSPPPAPAVHYIELTITVLESAVQRSKYRYQLRLLLVRLYRLLGATTCAARHYIELGARAIQKDTLAFWALDRASSFFAEGKASPPGTVGKGTQAEARTLAEIGQDVLYSYKGADNDAQTSMVRAWQNNTFILLEDYLSLKDRLQHSFSRQAVAFEYCRNTSMLGAFDEGSYAEWHDLEIPKGQGALSDNRDVSVLPNYQPASERSIFEQVQTGPPTTTGWLQAMSGVYAEFWTTEAAGEEADAAQLSPSQALSALTEHEQRFVAWAGSVKAWLSGQSTKVEEATVTTFLKGCQADLAKTEVMTAQPWYALHIATIALEAYSLLDAAFVAKSASPGTFKGIKQFRQIRQDAKSAMKAISTRLKVMSDDLARRYKGRERLESLQPMLQPEQVGEAFLLDTATQLLEARKTAYTQLAVSITKRSAGA